MPSGREAAGHRLDALVQEGRPVRFLVPSADEASTQGLEELLSLSDLPTASEHQVNQVVEGVFRIAEARKVAVRLTPEGGQDAVDVEEVRLPGRGVRRNPLLDPGILHGTAISTNGETFCGIRESSEHANVRRALWCQAAQLFYWPVLGSAGGALFFQPADVPAAGYWCRFFFQRKKNRHQ